MEKNNTGHMAKVGYDMYLAMLERAVNKLKNGEEMKPEQDEKEVKIDLGVSAYISDSYIKDPISKIAMYQKISNIENKDDMMDVIDELLDRYGNIPQETENLIKIVEIRNICKKLNITKIFEYQNVIKIEPNNLRINLTNVKNNDILLTVQLELEKILKEKGKKNE